MKIMIGVFVVFLLGACSASPQPNASAANSEVTQMPPEVSASQGLVLFRDKGCVTCHVNQRVEGDTQSVYNFNAPDLTNYTNDPAFLRRWLSDPSAVRSDAQMPNLRLSETEIDNLIAFLNEVR